MANNVPMTFSVFVDWDNDGSFATTGDDITAYVLSINDITLGVGDLRESRIAYVGNLSITLKNTDRRFSPGYTGSPYYGKLLSNRPIKVTITDGVTTWTLFNGFTRRFTPSTGQYGARNIELEAADIIGKIQDEIISIPLQENVTADTLIKMIINSALKAPAATGTVTLSAAPANNDTLTPNSTLFTYKTSLSGAANEIVIGTGKVTPILNTVAALNGSEGAGTSYASLNNKPVGLTASHNILAYYDSPNQDSDVLLQNTSAPVKTKLSQSFILNQGGSTNTVQLYLKKVGTPTGTLTLRIETDSGYSPSGTLLDANATATLAESSLTTSYAWYTFTFPATVTIPVGNPYWLVLSTDRASSGTNYVSWGADNSTPTGTGDFYYFSGSWTNSGMDAIFILGNPAITITASIRGVIGNAYTLAKSSSAITLSGATLTGGLDYPTNPPVSVQTGVKTFDIAGDSWANGDTNGMSALEEVLDSEQGVLWADRDGTIRFKNLDYLFTQAAATTTLALSSQQNDLLGSLDHADVFNRVEVTFTPRSNLSSGVVAVSKSQISVPGYSSITVRLPFTDPATGLPMGAKSLITPLSPGTDFTANDFSDFSGFNYTNGGFVTFTLAVNGNNVDITLLNHASGTLYVNGLQVRGSGIVHYNPATMIAEDTSLQDSYGRRVLGVKLPLPTGSTFAQALAQYLLSRYKTPAYRITEIAFNSQNKIGTVNLFSLNIGDILTITDYQAGISSQDYLITGIRYGGIFARNTGSISFSLYRLDDTTYAVYDDPVLGLYDGTGVNYSL